MQSQQPPVMVATYKEGIERVRGSKSGRYALILEETTNNYINIRPPCNTMKVGGSNLNSVGFGVATPFGSELRSLLPNKLNVQQKFGFIHSFFRARINLAILELQEMGELSKLERRWWYGENKGDPCKLAVATKVKNLFNVHPTVRY